MHRLRLPGSLEFPYRRDRLGSIGRSSLYSLIALPIALTGLALVVAVLLIGAVLSWTALGLWLIAAAVRGALALGDLQRALARGLLGLEIDPCGAGGDERRVRLAALGAGRAARLAGGGLRTGGPADGPRRPSAPYASALCTGCF